MKKHIIFDMDGVIIDSEPEYQKRIKIFMERNGFTITDELSFQILRIKPKGYVRTVSGKCTGLRYEL